MASHVQTQMEANALLREHGLADAGWHFGWDNARRRGGQCDFGMKRITMSRYLVPAWTEEEVRQTLLHEVAHALAGHKAAHGPEWVRIARSLGHSGERTHNNAVVTAPWIATCPTHGNIGEAHRRGKARGCALCYKRGAWVPISYVRNPALAVSAYTR